MCTTLVALLHRRRYHLRISFPCLSFIRPTTLNTHWWTNPRLRESTYHDNITSMLGFGVAAMVTSKHAPLVILAHKKFNLSLKRRSTPSPAHLLHHFLSILHIIRLTMGGNWIPHRIIWDTKMADRVTCHSWITEVLRWISGIWSHDLWLIYQNQGDDDELFRKLEVS